MLVPEYAEGTKPINAPVYIGAPQSWNAAAGTTITAKGALHTIISDLTFTGAGTTTISGLIDGGGAANTAGAKPGNLIQNGSGLVVLSGASNFAGDITVSSGTLALNPTTAATYTGSLYGSGTLSINTAGTVSLGGTSSFNGPVNVVNGTLQFVPVAGATTSFRGQITSAGPIVQNGPGTTFLSGTNSYTGDTIISNGALQLGVARVMSLGMSGRV